MRHAMLSGSCLLISALATSGALGAGPSYTQIRQGYGSTAWLLAPMAAVQARGVDLSRRVADRGNHVYYVSLYYHSPTHSEAGLEGVPSVVEM
jgi:hypothetical protein